MTDYKHMFLFLTTHGLVVRCYRTPMPTIDHTMTHAYFNKFGLREWLSDFDEVIVAENEDIKFRKMALNSTSIFLTKQANKLFKEGIEIDKDRVEFICIHCNLLLEKHKLHVGCLNGENPKYLAYLLPKQLKKMKKITLEIEYDDTNGYKGHGEDTAELIKNALENELEMSLEADGVIKEGWKLTLNK